MAWGLQSGPPIDCQKRHIGIRLWVDPVATTIRQNPMQGRHPYPRDYQTKFPPVFIVSNPIETIGLRRLEVILTACMRRIVLLLAEITGHNLRRSCGECTSMSLKTGPGSIGARKE